MLVSKFLAERLENAGVKHVFGVPGDYVLDFYKELWENEKIRVINNTDENHSGFAADAYARVNGIGCVLTTYSVGASKVINACQCAYAERSPLIVISGAPGLNERNEGFLLHHMVGSFNAQRSMFQNITCASVVLDNPSTAGYEIDKAITSLLYYKRPIYLELPRDVAKMPISYDVYNQGTPNVPKTDVENLNEAVGEVVDWVSKAKRPVILAGVELARYDLGGQLIRFAEKANIPIACTLLSKSVVAENHPLFAGVYSGSASNKSTKDLVEESDCLLMFGVMLTDMALCFRPAKFKKRQVVSASIETLRVKNHTYMDVNFKDFCESLFRVEISKKEPITLPEKLPRDPWVPVNSKKITTLRFFQKINSIINKNMAIIADIGDSLFGAAELTVHHRHCFLSPAFYTSMGSAIPGALGVQTAMPEVRPLVIVGDGAFQMSCNELSTIVACDLNPIVFVLNNDGFATERCLLDGGFNDIQRWNYHKIVEMINGGEGRLVTTEDELERSVAEALSSKKLFVINIQVDRKDITSGLKRMTEFLAQRI